MRLLDKFKNLFKREDKWKAIKTSGINLRKYKSLSFDKVRGAFGNPASSRDDHMEIRLKGNILARYLKGGANA